jgi:polyribonucleotide nucleotidyltransferase
MAYVLSADEKNDPDIIAITGASVAALIGNIPINAPIAAVRVGLIDNEFVLNPGHKELEQSALDLVISGSVEEIVMVEAGAREVTEKIMTEAISWGHEQLKEIISLELELIRDFDITSITPPPEDTEAVDIYQKIKEGYKEEIASALQITKKQERQKAINELYSKIENELFPEESRQNALEQDKLIKLAKAYKKNQKELVRQWIKSGKRSDGRDFKDIRPIECEVGFLPRPHGSSLFTRGETQAMVTVTLGSPSDEQIVEGLQPESSKHFMLHYNFPPFSVGEIRPVRGPMRREIGHGA